MTELEMLAMIDAAMLHAVAETMENLAFMEALPIEEEGAPDPAAMTAALLFHEPYQGEIRIALPRRLLAEIAENLSGPGESELAEPLLKDVLAEILNTVAGRFLDELLPADQTFRIGLPELDPPDAAGATPFRQWHFNTDTDRFSVVITDFFTFHPFAKPVG